MLPRVRRTLAMAGAILVFLLLAGTTYQGVATALERRTFRHPGRMVNAVGHQLHISCSGAGSPTVVLEAGAAGMSAAWGWVQPRIAEVTRVCSYDRAGLGWSETGDVPYDPAAVAPALNALLDHAGEHPPFVLAGQGLGTAFSTLYASNFPDQVAALVLIDPPADAARQATGTSTRLVSASPWLARAGVLRATGIISRKAAGLPAPFAGTLSAFLNRPDHLTRAASEFSRWDEALALAGGAPLREGLTVIRVEAGGPDKVAFLTGRADAAMAEAAVLDAVARIRSGH
ncbi:MAG: alpha/beta hydrolase [Acidobacteria bacterium]|nr:alpha/beta hydrolase [Acidobacteriota bacterium]